MKRVDRIGLTVALLASLLAVAACSKDPEVAKRDHLARGDKYVAENKLYEAVIEYKNAKNLDAKFGEAYYKLGETYEKLADAHAGKRETAEARAALTNAYQQYIRAQQLLPERDDVQLNVARFLGRVAGEYAQAKEVLETLVGKNPKNTEARILLADTMKELKDLPSAIKQMEAAVNEDPTRIDAYVSLAWYQTASKNTADAERTLRRALAAKPESVEARVALAKLYLATREVAKAETELKDALRLQPKDPEANQQLAFVYLVSGRQKEAEGPLKLLADSGTGFRPKLELADYYLATNRSQDAVPILNELVKDKDGRAPASLMLARWEIANSQKDAAHKHLDDLLAQEAANADALLLKAQLLGSDGKVDDAIVKAQAAAAAASGRPDIAYTLGMLHLQKKDTQAALKAFNDVLVLKPGDPSASLQVAKLQLERLLPDIQANPAAAKDSLRAVVTSLEGVVSKLPGNPDAQATLVRALVGQAQISLAEKDVALAQTQLSQAEQKAAKLAADAPTSAEAQNLVGSVALARGNLPAARAAYAKALALDKNSTAALAGLMGADMKIGRPADAQARLSARLAADPNNPALLEIAWRAYKAMGDTAKTEQERALRRTEQEQALRKLIQADPSNMQAYSVLTQLLFDQRRLDEAKREIEQIVQRNPKDVGAQTFVGIILELQNRTAEAQKKYEEIIQMDPGAAVAANNLAWIYAEQNVNLETALQLAETAKGKLRDMPQVDDTLGWVYYKKGLFPLAISSFERSVKADPKNAGYHYHLGLAHAKNGDKVKARQSLEKAAALGGDSKDATEAKKVLATLG